MDKKVLTVQDISCVGQCSLTVALPIISACGIEPAILPSAVLSTHTSGFKGFTFRDLTEDIPAIVDHWERERIQFDAIYTGYLGSLRQIDLVKDLFVRVAAPDCIKVVDPAMADHGVMYTGFDDAFAAHMATLCAKADIVLPNITEATKMLGMPFVAEGYTQDYVETIMEGLLALGAGTVVLTGVGFAPDALGVAVRSKTDTETSYYFHVRLAKNSHGTGDIYASALVGAMMRGKTAVQAAKIAADYTVDCIKETAKLDNHWYGAAFEPVLYKLHDYLK